MMKDKEVQSHLVMVEFPLATAKITILTEIDNFKQRFQRYREAVENGESNGMLQVISEDLKNRAGYLYAISHALSPIFGEALKSKVFDATNHYDVEKMDIAALNEVLAELEERFPLSACYK